MGGTRRPSCAAPRAHAPSVVLPRGARQRRTDGAACGVASQPPSRRRGGGGAEGARVRRGCAGRPRSARGRRSTRHPSLAASTHTPTSTSRPPPSATHGPPPSATHVLCVHVGARRHQRRHRFRVAIFRGFMQRGILLPRGAGGQGRQVGWEAGAAGGMGGMGGGGCGAIVCAKGN